MHCVKNSTHFTKRIIDSSARHQKLLTDRSESLCESLKDRFDSQVEVQIIFLVSTLISFEILYKTWKSRFFKCPLRPKPPGIDGQVCGGVCQASFQDHCAALVQDKELIKKSLHDRIQQLEWGWFKLFGKIGGKKIQHLRDLATICPNLTCLTCWKDPMKYFLPTFLWQFLYSHAVRII